MTNLYTIDHSKLTGYLRNYDPIYQYVCLFPHNDTSRPLTVPQEYLINFDDFLLLDNISSQIFKPLTNFKHLVSSPLDDQDTTYYTALYKQLYSYYEFFISAIVISYMVKLEQKTEHKSSHFERHRSSSRTSQSTSDKMTVMLSFRTLRNRTEKLEAYSYFSTRQQLNLEYKMLPTPFQLTTPQHRIIRSLTQDIIQVK